MKAPDIDALLGAHVRKPKGGVCTVGILLGQLDPDVRAKFQTALNDLDTYAATGLAAALSELVGRRITATTVARHRRRECMCR